MTRDKSVHPGLKLQVDFDRQVFPPAALNMRCLTWLPPSSTFVRFIFWPTGPISKKSPPRRDNMSRIGGSYSVVKY